MVVKRLDGLPDRWVVRKGAPCMVTLHADPETAKGLQVQRGLHCFVALPYIAFGTPTRALGYCLWCDRPDNDRGEGWTVHNPATAAATYHADYATAVRYASAGWHASLDPMQRLWHTTYKTARALERAGAF